ncbi:hypothetical protein ADK60_27230 [Streptomyces sp. XY431]|nr:hypothetical protein ADK60_27230 [Streptomyces sp. XY431]
MHPDADVDDDRTGESSAQDFYIASRVCSVGDSRPEHLTFSDGFRVRARTRPPAGRSRPGHPALAGLRSWRGSAALSSAHRS